MADKKISELDQTLNLSDQADFPLSQDNGGEPTTFRAKLTQIATKIAEAITFSNLKTGNKQLVSAVNQTISNLADDFNTTAGSTYSKDDCVLYNGVLYQCINNSGTTSGTFIDADWTAIKAVDVGSGGGGGGGAGGHTIVDDSGTALTQRTNLQFKGTYSEDNATDDTTEINIIRSMTKAEFNQLSAAEKLGLINITDEEGQITADNLPISSSDPTNTKTYIDNGLSEIPFIKSVLLSGTINCNTADASTIGYRNTDGNKVNLTTRTGYPTGKTIIAYVVEKACVQNNVNQGCIAIIDGTDLYFNSKVNSICEWAIRVIYID